MLRGYLDQLDVEPGSGLSVRLSDADQEPSAHVLRFSHSDPHPGGPGVLTEPQDWPVTQLQAVREAAVQAGSFGVIPTCFTAADPALVFAAWILPTQLDDTSVIAAWRSTAGPGRLLISAGRLAVTAGSRVLARSEHMLRERLWHFVAVSISGPGSSVELAWGQHGRTGGPYSVTRHPVLAPVPSPGSPLVLGGTLREDGQPEGAFDGKISAPVLLRQPPDSIALMDIMNWGADATLPRAGLLARWAFGDPGDLARIVDLTGNDHHGSLCNAPSLGVTGPPPIRNEAPPPGPSRPPYQTAHFHRDDLDDCRWPETHILEIPPDARSGFYTLRAASSGGQADLPFIVLPQRRAEVLLLAPTFTWQAYANLGRDPALYPGLSHYALHGDGSPVFISTRRKPMPGIGPAARVEVDAVDAFLSADPDDPAGMATHLLMADLYANYWLERTGTDFGVTTDGVLHARGTAALEGCRTLVLSAHPEYWTGAMLDALEQFIDQGGNVIYLGGNGLYWVTSVHPTQPHLLEVRRWGGSQTSSAEPMERYHVFEPQPGGTWSDRGRPPDRLVSVGYTGFGYGAAIAYERTAASYADGFSWVFEGVPGHTIGTEGLNTGGAVGFEFDRYDERTGPAGCTVLASAVASGGSYFRNFEGGIGRAPDPEVRCDLTIRRTPAGGLVFSLGSITASGCLPVREGDNDVARICTNVLRKTLT
jgi:N,N-dimethylformamidase